MDYEDASEFHKGWTEAGIAIVQIWNSFKDKFDGDLLKAGQAFDVFMNGVTSRLSGESLESIEEDYDQKMKELGLDSGD